MGFALFSLGEYANMLLMSAFNVILFFGGWMSPFTSFLSFIPGSFWFASKICFFVILFVWMRAALPRYRYDQLMSLGWKVFLPLSLTYLMLTFSALMSFNILPY
jgi:NADH-quinone oxidoreductase subunit H